MKACIVICRMNKPRARRNKVLFIDTVNEVTRERAQSFLTEEHMQHIVAAYRAFSDEDGFARAVGNDEIRENANNLSIPLYVEGEERRARGKNPDTSFKQAIANWQESSMALRESMDEFFKMLEKELSADRAD